MTKMDEQRIEATTEKRPSARQLRHQRITGQIHPLLPTKVFRPGAAVTDSFLESKHDRRLIRHSSFLSRVRSSSDKVTKSGGSSRRRRRPGNKIASLDSLGDALPDLDDELATGSGAGAGAPAHGKIRHKSLRTGRGALKKKEKLVRGEMERFGVSWARLADAPPPVTVKDEEMDDDDSQQQQQKQDGEKIGIDTVAPTPAPAPAPAPATANRWAALRGFISATMEQNPAFVKR
ncbi:hypothetical protein GMORB2_0710 [Geosmithia morbida]|uniref:Ribosome biogenesis protein SLX9 n=1 Tax=Geosmithia morbida TaxID=1094350 RepID=A0A9P4Z493_9HYPO|nr:uncharacterized protein GMORB2_0710 [Geosmithia morbida]KAF4126973.1 hypothetical protein GMORB2_0710 [Geosmithia morbida]